VEFVVRPEPDPDKREALVVALERLLGEADVPSAYKSRWRSDGIAENLGGEEER
jgi:hypothetical protein